MQIYTSNRRAMANAVQEMPTYSGCNNVNKVTWKHESSSRRPRRAQQGPLGPMSEARSSPSRKLTDSGRLGPRPSSRKADLQPRPPVREISQISDLSQQNGEQKTVIRSRARRRRHWEASPFLSVNTVSPDKAVIDGAPEPPTSAASSSNGHRQSNRPIQKERKLSSRKQSGQLRSRTPKLASRCSSRALSRGTPFDFYSFYTHKNPSFITGPPNLWSMGNKFWPSSGRPTERNQRVVPSVTTIESSSVYPNQQVQQPFKHADNAEPLPERCPAPDMELKIQTAGAISHVSKSLAAERDVPTSKHRGRLLKARLKPLHAFTPVGPRVDQCAGVQPEKKPQSPTQLQLQMRKKQLLDMLPPGIFQERPETRESVHQTSVVSNLSEDRQYDFDGFQGEGNETWTESCKILPNSFTGIDHEHLLDQIDIPTDPEMEENLMQYMSIHSPNKKTLSKLLDGSAGDSMACFSDVLIDGAAGMIDSALTRGKNRRKPVEDKVTFTTQKSILKTSKATAENIFSELVWNGNSLERVQTAPEQGTQNYFGDETFDIDAERPVTAPDQPNILEAVAKQHLEKLLKEEEGGGTMQEGDASDLSLGERIVKFETLAPTHDGQAMSIVEEHVANEAKDVAGDLINETSSETLQITSAPIIEITVNLANRVTSENVSKDRTLNHDAHKPGDLNENYISLEHVSSNVKPIEPSQTNDSIGNEIESFKFDQTDIVLSTEQESDTNENVINDEDEQGNSFMEELNRGMSNIVLDSRNPSNNNNNVIERNMVENKQLKDMQQSECENDMANEVVHGALENLLANSIIDTHSSSADHTKERDIFDIVKGNEMSVESKETDPQESGDRNEDMSGAFPEGTYEQLIDTFQPNGFLDHNSINNEDTKLTESNANQQSGKKCSDGKESLKNLPKTVQFAIPTEIICLDYENVPDANVITESASSQGSELPKGNDTNVKSEWLFLTEDESSNNRESIPNNVELTADICAKDYGLKESSTISDANTNDVIEKTQSDDVEEEDDDENNEEEGEDAPDIDNDDTNGDDGDGNGGSGSDGGTGPRGPADNTDQAHDNQSFDDQNNGSGEHGSNSEPKTRTSEGSGLSRAVNLTSRSQLAIDQFVESKLWDVDFEYSDIPEVDESVLFCGICGLDEDMCVCPSAKVGSTNYQSCTRIDSGYTGSFTSRSDQSLAAIESVKECWSPREDLQLADEANDLVTMYRKAYDNKSTDKDTSDNQTTTVSVDEAQSVNDDVSVEGSAETDDEDSSSNKTVTLNQDVSVSNLDDPNSLSVVAKSKQISKTRSKIDEASPIALLPPVCFRINARPPPDHVYYFAYGENMNKNRVLLYIGRKEVQRLWGLLFGFQLKFNKKGSDSAAGVFANIESSPENSVEGCVYLITKSELKHLDKYTGCPQFFSHVMFPVWMINSNDPDALGVAQYCIPAVMYIANDKWTTTDMTLTSEYSVQQCLRGSELLTPRYAQHIAGCARS